MTYEEELRQHYLQVKKRLYNSGIKMIATPKPETVKVFAEEANIYRPQWQIIIDEVCEKHGVTKEMMLSKTRKHKISHARFEAMYRMRNEIKISGEPMSYFRIKHVFGNDHATVIHGIKRFEEMMGR